MTNSRLPAAVVAAAAVMAYGCSTSGAAKAAVDLEPLVGLVVEAQVLRLDVISTGCTKRQDFELSVERGPNDSYQTLTVTRKKPDVCRAMPHTKAVRFETTPLALDVPIRLQNPFVSPPALVRRP